MKQTHTLFIKLFLLVALLTGAKAYATEFISEVKVVGGNSSEVNTLTSTLIAQGWKRINYDLNTKAGGDYIFLFYKTVENTDGEYHDNYITDFYIKSEARDVDDELTYEGRTYHLAPYDGGSDFINSKGDLNCNTTTAGRRIHLYYTKDIFTNHQAVTGITIDNTSGGAVGENGDPNTPADLNRGANGAYIYMHFTTATFTQLNNSYAPCDWGTANTTSIYKVTGDYYYDSRITVNGDVRLFLGEGTTLTADDGITVSEGNKLTIDGTGSLIANGRASAAIGGFCDENFTAYGEIVINNGHITATGSTMYGNAAIGGAAWNDSNGANSKITINGGVIYARGGVGGAAIGGGDADSNHSYYINDPLASTTELLDYEGMPGTVIINGGQVTAIADPTINAIGRGTYATGNSGSVTLGWTNPTDFIYATRLDLNNLSIAEGKAFVIDDTGIEVNNDNIGILVNLDNGGLWPNNVKTLGAVTVSGVPDVLTNRNEAIPLNYTVTDATGIPLIEGTDYNASLTFQNGNGYVPATELYAVGSYKLTLTAAGEYVGIREFHIEVVDFSVPTELRQTGYADSSVTLEWNVNGGNSGLTLQYSTDNTFTASVTELEVSGSSTTIEGLDNTLSYYARIKAHNGNKTTDWSDTIRFEASDKTWSGMNKEVEYHSNCLPVSHNQDHTISQQIYTPSEIGHAGPIDRLSFHLMDGNYEDFSLSWNIYIVYTNQSCFNHLFWQSKGDFQGVDYGYWLADDGVSYSDDDKVFSGIINFTRNSWNTVTLDTPFNYDGIRNIAIIIETYHSSRANIRFDRYLVCDEFQSIAIGEYNYQPPYTTGCPIVIGIVNDYSQYQYDVQYFYNSELYKEAVRNEYPRIKSSIRFGFKEIDLADQTDNTGILSDNNGKYSLVTLSNRTIYSDNDWNTLCLPFNMGDANAEAGHHFDGTELDGAIVKQLDAANSSLSNNGMLTLNFTDANSIEAGKPYIVKWNPGSFHTDAQGRRIIYTADDWNAFASNPYTDAILAADISVTTMVGVFYGTFDGNGHTITFNCGNTGAPYSGQYCALFSTINGATIKNLHVAGNIYTNNEYAGGLVGKAMGQCTITNCHVSTKVTGVWGEHGGGLYNGGIIGCVAYNSNTKGEVSITDCLFDGQLNGIGRGIFGCKGFVGCLLKSSQNNNDVSAATITRSLFDPSATPNVLLSYAATFAVGEIYDNNIPGTATITDCYYTQALGLRQGTDASSMSAADLAAALGSNWTVSGGNVVPVLTTTNNINLNNPSFGPYQIVGTAPAAVTFDEGRCSFQGTYEPFNDRTGLLLDKRNTTGNGVFQAGIDLKGYVVNGWFTDAAHTTPATSIPFDENTGQVTLYLNTTEAVKRTVNAATNWDDPTLPIDGWNFVSSPVTGSIAPSAVTNLFPLVENVPNPLSTNYDLYRLNTAEVQWENYKTHTNDFTLDNGLGYLYASKDKTTLVFTAGNSSFNTGTSKTIDNLPEGFNLVGNPFKVNAYINKPYYIMDETGTYVVPTVVEASNPIAPCTGIVVEITDNDITNSTNSVTFSTTLPSQSTGNNGHLNIALSEQVTTRGGASTHSIDQTIVSFNEGARLGKFHFGDQNANISIPMGHEDYAIAYSDKRGEMPLNFKARENGTYTLNFSGDVIARSAATKQSNMTGFSYLHLIDNLTGDNIDLLQTPSYTFEGKTDDYASRFRLVFVSNDAELDNEMFAFVSDGQIIIVGDGLVQVIDLLGHTLVSKENAHRIPTASMSPGVYVLRLINGEKTKTQKIVIK